jgi:hypothetical protein
MCSSSNRNSRIGRWAPKLKQAGSLVILLHHVFPGHDVYAAGRVGNLAAALLMLLFGSR